jgi:putative ABC transport system permease protein
MELGVDPDAHVSLVDELAQFLDDRFRATLAAGASLDAARSAALAELDGSHRLADELRATRPPSPAIVPGDPRGRLFAGLWQDVTYASRTLRRSPAFTIAAVLTIALSTGPTIAALGIANWLFFRPVPGVVAPDRLGVVWFGRWEGSTSFSPSRVAYPHIEEMQRSLTSIDAIVGQQPSTSVNLAIDAGAPRVVEAQFVTANYFDVLGVRMTQGRGFRAEEDRDPGGSPVAVLTHTLAQSLFADSAAAGQTIRVNGHAIEVIGVASAEFRGAVTGDRPQLWLPGRATPRISHSPPERWAYAPDRGPFYQFLVRLRRGATFEQADAELQAAAKRLLDGGRPETAKYETVTPTLFPELGLDPFARQSMRPFAGLLVGIAGVLVLLAAANLVNLFMFRGARRLHEAALRRSLGASAARLARLHIVEALIVSVAGAAGGFAIVVAARAWLSTRVLFGVGVLEVAFDWRLFAATAVLTAIIAVVLGSAPARAAARRSLTTTLAASPRTATKTGGRFRTGLAVTQLALSLTLLVGGLLFVQTLRNLHAEDLGIDPSPVTTSSFAVRGQAYDAARTRDFYRQLIDRLRATPGVEAASAATGLPLMSRSSFRVLPPDVAALEGKSNRELFDLAVPSLHNNVTPDYFRTFGMRILFGRTFTEAEGYTGGVEPGVVISASLAERLFKTTNAVGRSLSFPAQGSLPRHDAPIVGVVNDVRWSGPERPADFVVYRPFGDQALGSVLAVRSTLPRADVSRLIRSAAATIDPAVPVQFDLSMQQIWDRMMAQRLIFAWVLGVLAALGFALAAVGIFGLVSQAVIERVREFGIRLAIGAQRRDVARLVLKQALVIAAIGVPSGILLAAVSSRFIAAQLFGVTPLAAGVYAAATLTLLAAVFAAVIHPALRAMRVNPVEVMRVD